MNFIKAGAEIAFKDTDVTKAEEVYKKLEQIGRCCYKSEERITDVSAVEFLEMLKGKKHNAMIEHHRFTLEVDEDLFTALSSFSTKYKYIMYSKFMDSEAKKERFLVTGSPRAWIEAPKTYVNDIVRKYLYDRFPVLLAGATMVDKIQDNEKKIQLLSEEDIWKLPLEQRKLHQTITVKFVCDRGVSHELVRHRPCSFAQESTRYCNYSKSKFGGELTYVLPNWMDDKFLGSWRFNDTEIHLLINTETTDVIDELTVTEENYFRACQTSEICYLNLTGEGWAPQQARSVLCNSLKTEVFVTAELQEWIIFLGLRESPAAHPQMQEVASIVGANMRADKYFE